MMKHKRIIRIKNSKLQKIRNNLRKVWLAATTSQWKEHSNELEKIRKTERGYRRKNYTQKQLEKKHELVEKQRELDRLDNRSICQCSVCNSTTKDMQFNAELKEWYCPTCFQEMVDFYYDQKDKRAKGLVFDDFNEEYFETFLD